MYYTYAIITSNIVGFRPPRTKTLVFGRTNTSVVLCTLNSVAQPVSFFQFFTGDGKTKHLPAYHPPTNILLNTYMYDVKYGVINISQRDIHSHSIMKYQTFFFMKLKSTSVKNASHKCSPRFNECLDWNDQKNKTQVQAILD